MVKCHHPPANGFTCGSRHLNLQGFVSIVSGNCNRPDRRALGLVVANRFDRADDGRPVGIVSADSHLALAGKPFVHRVGAACDDIKIGDDGGVGGDGETIGGRAV